MPEIKSKFLLSRNNVDFSELLAVDGGNPTIRMVVSAEVKMVLEGTFLQNPQMNFIQDHLKPVFYIDGKGYQVGEYIVTDAVLNTVDGTRKELEITAYDLTYLAKQSKIEDRLLIKAGTLYTDAIRAQIVDSGILNFIVVPNTATFATDREDWEPGTSRLQIINDLLSEINYNSLWMDLSGTVRGTAVVENPDLPENLRAEAVNDDPTVPYSTVNRGRIAQYEKLDNIASQAELQAYVDNLKFKSLMSTQEIEFSTAANPVHSAFDIIGFYKDDLTGIYEETEWSFPFTPGQAMTHRARRAIFE